MRIDAHQHFWRYSPAEYPWIGEDLATLRRDFLPADLGRELAGAGIDCSVAVQARQSLAETEWLLSLAGASPIVRGLVGWAPLADPGVEGMLERLAANRRLRGLRHVVQDEPDDRFILGAAFNRGVDAVGRLGLAYDILVLPRQLGHCLEFVDRHPDQVLILDHLGKPPIAAGAFEPWAELVRELARRPNLSCKLSGMVTEADRHGWTPEGLHPWFEVALEAFGPRRLMFGSDWPVCLAATGYARWFETVTAWASVLSESERERLLGGTAMEVYQL